MASIEGLQEHISAVAGAPVIGRGPFADLARTRARYLSRDKVLEIAMGLVSSVPGAVVEFGIGKGFSARTIRACTDKHVYALDSFEGLRERFENAQVGAFAGPVPDVPGVNIVKGFFEDTCDEALRTAIGPVAFAHMDADLYSSTLFALHWIAPLLVDGSLILFDEFTGGERSEARALAQWQQELGIVVVRIAEFDRDPSGWGEIPDRRVLFQIIKG